MRPGPQSPHSGPHRRAQLRLGRSLRAGAGRPNRSGIPAVQLGPATETQAMLQGIGASANHPERVTIAQSRAEDGAQRYSVPEAEIQGSEADLPAAAFSESQRAVRGRPGVAGDSGEFGILCPADCEEVC